jgi:hypothetical protein
MITNILFDTHAYIDTLERSGVPREHAVAISKANQEMLAETLQTGVATKSDVADIQQSIQSLDKRIDGLDKRIEGLDSKLERVSLQLTIRLGSMIVVATGVISAMIKLF